MAAEYRGVRVDGDIILDGRMTLYMCQLLVHTQCTERHALIQAHVIADARGLADDDSGTVIDGESFSDRRTGMKIDTGPLMRPLGDEPRDDRHTAVPEWLRDPVTDGGQKPRIGQKYLVHTLGRGIHLMERLGIGVQTDADPGQRCHQSVGIGCCVVTFRPQSPQQLLQRGRHTVVLGADSNVIAARAGRGGVREEQGQNAAHPVPHRFVQPRRKRIRGAGFAELRQKSLSVVCHRRQTIRAGNLPTAVLAGPGIALEYAEYLSHATSA